MSVAVFVHASFAWDNRDDLGECQVREGEERGGRKWVGGGRGGLQIENVKVSLVQYMQREIKIALGEMRSTKNFGFKRGHR